MKRTSTAVVAFIAALAPAGVWAQGSGNAPQPASERRPFRGIFGSPSSPNPQSLVLSGSLFGSHDDNVLAGLVDRNTQDWRVQRRGAYGAAHAGLDYAFSRTGTRVSFGAQTGGQVRYYRHTDLSNVAPHYNAGANLRVALSRSTTLSADHRFLYSREYRLSTFPAAAGEAFAEDVSSVANPDYEIFQLPSLRNSTRVSFTQNFGRRASLTAGYGLRSLDFLDDTADEQAVNRQLRDYRTQSASVGFQYSRPFTPHTSLNLGYRLRISDSRQGTGEPPAMHDVNAGLSYSRALSFSRRTSLSFSTGSAVAVSEDILESESRMRVRLTGNLSLVHELGRTWTAQVVYNRGFTFHEGFNEPFFSDRVTAGIGGLVTRRLSLSADSAWVLSELNGGGRTGQTGFTGNARGTYALNRYLALFAQYLYYSYEFEGDVPLDPRFPRALDRQGIRVGITTSVPLLR